MLTIIVPVYNTNKYIEKCINSILAQTYGDYEILIIDDGSDKDCSDELLSYTQRGPHVRVIRHNVNKGLFAARVTGMEAANGDYITFLDSDDMVSRDYYRIMVQKAESQEADIVVGDTVEEEYSFLHTKNLHTAAFSADTLEAEEVQRFYWGQEGNCFAWHTVWNKLYSRELINRCLPYFKRISEHLVMTEDVAFSSVFFLLAERVCFTHSGAYFYIHHIGNSTDSEQISLEKYRKSIHDLCVSFSFVEKILKETGQPEWKKECFLRFRALYARRWNAIRQSLALPEERIEAEGIFSAFYENNPQLGRNDYFYHECKTVWDKRMEELKLKVIQGGYKYISFDIFDTLLTRPFTMPQDLYYLLDERYHALIDSDSGFHDIRMNGESAYRLEMRITHPEWQDITIDEIYAYIQKAYKLPEEVCSNLLSYEKELEIKYIGCRHALKEVYELAVMSDKKVLLISDMYLDEKTILKLLNKHGYTEYERLFLSSKDRKVKWTGDLYRKAMEEFGITPDELLHIGDNRETDIKMAGQMGIDAFHVPRTVELFEQNCTSPLKYICGNSISRSYSNMSSGFGCMQAMAANKYFDNPFRPFHHETDYNMDPYLIGYHAVGMHLAGLVKWICNTAESNHYKRIVFTSRDGYLPMKAYNIYRRFHPDIPEAVYIHVSRKALIPVMLRNKADFYELPIIAEYYSPRKLLDFLEFCLNRDACNNISADEINMEADFSNKLEFHRFISYFLDHLYSEEKHFRKVQEIREYFKRLAVGDIIFDMGYSGRIQSALCKAVGIQLDAMFVYGGHELQKREYKDNFHVYRFYNVLPDAPDFLREYLLSDPAPACIGYNMIGNTVTPIWEKDNKQANELFVIHTIQRAALEFLDEFYHTFSNCEDSICFSPQEVSLPFEGFLRYAARQDRHIFSACYGEDKVYSARSIFNVEDFLNGQYEERKNIETFFNELEGVSANLLEFIKGRKLVLFGTGKICEKLYKKYPDMPVSFYLDNDPEKNGGLRFGKMIQNPAFIKDWPSLYIIIANRYVEDISLQLEGAGLKKYRDFISYQELEAIHIRRD